MLRIDFVTLFPEMMLGACRHSMLHRAEEGGLVAFGAANPRDFTTDKHRTVDDTPYGGGPGMLMKPEPLDAALELVVGSKQGACAVIMPDPTGRLFTQAEAKELVCVPHIAFLCGHYEGIDERLCTKWVTHRFSIGDYVLTGGELPALVMADTIVRLVPGVLGDTQSLAIDSHADGLLSAPQYTRPANWDGAVVPPVLSSGDHKAIERWKRGESLRITRASRPDLFAKAKLAKSDLSLLESGTAEARHTVVPNEDFDR